MNSKVAVVRCKTYDSVSVFKEVKKAVDLLGGISSFIRPGSRVLIKPNLLMAKAPEYGITTHPEVVRSAIKILKGINCKIFVGDGPSVWGKQIENLSQVYTATGIRQVCEEEGVGLVEFDKRRMRQKFPLAAWLDDCDYLINIPKFKTHELTLLTGAVKNLFGLVSGTYKTELHKKYFDKEDFAKILVDIYAEVKPAFTIIDGIVGMEGDGPATAGKLRDIGLLLAGSDCIALDSIMASIMGARPLDVLFIREAAKRGLGNADIRAISILGEKLDEIIIKDFLLPSTSMKRKIPAPLLRLAKEMIKYYPCVEQDNCIACVACIDACPVKAVSMKNNRITFDYKKCIACFCCQEACPASAIKVKKSLFAKMIGL